MNGQEVKLGVNLQTLEQYKNIYPQSYKARLSDKNGDIAACKYMVSNPDDNWYSLGAICLGNLFCFYDPNKVQIPKGVNYPIVYVDDPRSETTSGGYLTHSLATLLALSTLEGNIRDSKVIDLGAGIGLQSLAALKMGASQVVMYEQNAEALETAKRLLSLNGISKDRVVYIKDDLANLKRYSEVLQDTNIAIANIGDWSSYGSAHLEATTVTDMIPEIRHYVAGGYGYLADSDLSWEFRLSLKANGEDYIKNKLKNSGLVLQRQVDITANGLMDNSRVFIFERR